MVAARLTSERPGSVIPVSKTFTLYGVQLQFQSVFDVFETDRKGLAVSALFLPFCHMASSIPRKQIASYLVTTVFVLY